MKKQETKICAGCNNLKPIKGFSKHNRLAEGLLDRYANSDS